MSAIETPFPVRDEEFVEPPEMIAHLYPPPADRTGKTLCGTPRESDHHRSLHKARGYKVNFVFGMTVCPSCAAQICTTCLAEADKWRATNREGM